MISQRPLIFLGRRAEYCSQTFHALAPLDPTLHCRSTTLQPVVCTLYPNRCALNPSDARGATMRQFVLGLGLMAVLVGCAKSPESIAPAYISELNYRNWNCYQLADEGQRLSSALAQASIQQENARTNDTVGVILLGLPVSSLSGDNIAPEIARLKGEQEAIRKASISKVCETASVAPVHQLR